jgi:hypothetical protein
VTATDSPAELIARAWIFEVETGFEPVYTALQAVASPLGHSTVQRWACSTDPRATAFGLGDPHLGEMMLQQLSHVRLHSAEVRSGRRREL